MALPVLLAVDEDQDALEDVETRLSRRYAREYRVECLGVPDEALRMLTDLARAGEEVALVLVGEGLLDAGGESLLERVRQLHPDAKRGLLVPSGAWAHPPTRRGDPRCDGRSEAHGLSGKNAYVVGGGTRLARQCCTCALCPGASRSWCAPSP